MRCGLQFCPLLVGGEWPSVPPRFIVSDKIWHPNVDPASGRVCMDLLRQRWSPAGGVLAILLSFRSLLNSPTLNDANENPANVDAANLCINNPAAYHAKNRRLWEADVGTPRRDRETR